MAVSIGSVQFGSAVASTLFPALGAPGTVLLRLLLAGGLLAVLLRPRVHRWSAGALGGCALLGAAMAGMNALFYLSIERLPLGVAVSVELLGPLVLSVVQARRAQDALWSGLALAGVVLLGVRALGDAGAGEGLDVPGLVLAASAGACWAGYILASAWVGRLVPGTGGLAVSLLVGAVLVAPFGLAGALEVVERPGLLLAALAVALLSSVVPYGADLAALRRLPTRVFGVLMSLQPVAAAIAGLVVLGQGLATAELVALALVSTASAGVALGRRRGEPVQARPEDVSRTTGRTRRRPRLR
ncbi:EamA family transporter [Pseudokineococcus marinus]|uniref:EamA family transporter n=2 Tax=Pseudokineococcus marinus TaxID=351215 RepID=A0A849BQ63_9ACTN|nr:EamA family transporter [Pseudokineococcus marinus]